MLSLLSKALLVLLAVYLFLVARVLLRLRGFRFRAPLLHYSGLDEISPAERAILDQPRAWLLAQGFRHVAWLQGEAMVQVPGAPARQPQALFLHRDGRLRCSVQVSPEPWQGVPYQLRFNTTLSDGTELVTVNRAGPLPAPPSMVLSDGYFAHDDEQLALHTGKTGGRECRVFRDIASVVAHHNQAGQQLFDWWRERWLTGTGEDCHLTWTGALAFFRRLLAHGRRLRQVPAPTRAMTGGTPAAVPVSGAGPAAPATPPAGGATAAGPAAAAGASLAPSATAAAPDALHHAEARMLAQLLDTEAAAGRDRKAKWRNFLLTGAAFLVLGYFFFDGGLGFIAALALVLLVHELGHYLAMRAFGYRDLSIFFLPLLGAAAAGNKDNAPPWQQLVILFAGPLPGLVLALAVLAGLALAAPLALASLPALAGGFVFQLLVLAIVINALNLLPILPLDGGRIAELLFFARFPRASFGFFVAGVLALLGAAAALADPLLGVMGALFALSLPFQWKLAQTARTLRPHFGHCADRDAALVQVAAAFAGGEGKAWPAVTRLGLARALLPRLQGGLPGLPTLLAGGVLYLGLLLSPLAALVAVGADSPAALVATLLGSGTNQEALRRQEARLAAATTVEEKVQAHLALYHLQRSPLGGQAGPARGDRHLEAAWRLLPPGRPLDAGRGAMGVLNARVLQRFEQDAVAGLALHAELREVLEKSAARRDVAQWLRFRDQLLQRHGLPLAVRIDNAREEVAVWEAARADAAAQGAGSARVPAAAEDFARRAGLLMARDHLASLCLQDGQGPAALALLKANVADSRPWFGDDYRYLRDHALQRLAWAHIAQGSAGEAAPLFASWAPPPAPFQEFEDDPWSATVPEQTLGWVAITDGRPADAVPIFRRLAEAAQEADPDRLNVPLLAAVELDLLVAQQRAGQRAPAAQTQQRLRELLAADAGSVDYLGELLALAVADRGNLAAPRAVAHREALQAMGLAPRR